MRKLAGTKTTYRRAHAAPLVGLGSGRVEYRILIAPELQRLPKTVTLRGPVILSLVLAEILTCFRDLQRTLCLASKRVWSKSKSIFHPAHLPKTILVGLAEAAVKESIHRIERALVNSGYRRPDDRIVINLSPADLPKDAASLDLPIALGLLTADGQAEQDFSRRTIYIGELALDGSLRAVKGVLSMALAARDSGHTHIVVPAANAMEAAVVDGIDVIAVGTLAEAVGFLTAQLPLEPVVFSWDHARRDFGRYEIDYVDVKGQEMAKRAVMVAAAGSHHLLMIGSPGTGKTLLSQRLCTILPELEPEESLETTRIYSAVAQLEPGQPLSAPTTVSIASSHDLRSRDLLVVEVFRSRVRSVCRTTGFCFWMSCLNSIGELWKSCVSLWKIRM